MAEIEKAGLPPDSASPFKGDGGELIGEVVSPPSFLDKRWETIKENRAQLIEAGINIGINLLTQNDYYRIGAKVAGKVGRKIIDGVYYKDVTPKTQTGSNIKALDLGGTKQITHEPKLSSKLRADNLPATIPGAKAIAGDLIQPQSNPLKIVRGKEGKIKGVTHTQEHHIIHQKLEKHPIWKASGVDCNDAINTMLLPTKKGADFSTTKRSIHEGRHLKEVSDQLRVKIEDAYKFGQKNNYTQEQYKKELEKIISDEHAELKSGHRALNKNAREWANNERFDIPVNDNSAETVNNDKSAVQNDSDQNIKKQSDASENDNNKSQDENLSILKTTKDITTAKDIDKAVDNQIVKDIMSHYLTCLWLIDNFTPEWLKILANQATATKVREKQMRKQYQDKIEEKIIADGPTEDKEDKKQELDDNNTQSLLQELAKVSAGKIKDEPDAEIVLEAEIASIIPVTNLLSSCHNHDLLNQEFSLIGNHSPEIEQY